MTNEQRAERLIEKYGFDFSRILKEEIIDGFVAYYRDFKADDDWEEPGMNFIDTTLADQCSMSDDEFLQAMADIYHEPEVWEILHKYPQYIQDVIYIIEYDTELRMEGLESVLEGPMSEKYGKIHTVLLNCGALEEARILEEARHLIGDSDEYDDDDYYEQMEALESRTALHNDYDHFWDLVRNYIGKCRKDASSF